MVNVIDGNILNCTEDIIVHQVNSNGCMGGGVARQLALQYPSLENIYNYYCLLEDFNYNKLKGKVFFYKENKTISNIFSQKPNYDTDYEEMKECLREVKRYAIKNSLSICMPYKIGCGIANGNWDTVYKIIEEVFTDYDVTLYRLI